MKKIIIILGMIIALIIIVLAVNLSGYWTFLNWPINKLVAKTPDQSCLLDADCKIAPTTCGPCDCGQAVNKNWQPYCPLKSMQRVLCKTCPSFQAVCRKYACRIENK